MVDVVPGNGKQRGLAHGSGMMYKIFELPRTKIRCFKTLF
jgi:hypothetical protein